MMLPSLFSQFLMVWFVASNLIIAALLLTLVGSLHSRRRPRRWCRGVLLRFLESLGHWVTHHCLRRNGRESSLDGWVEREPSIRAGLATEICALYERERKAVCA
ncbi:MAG TPA: hypothetical protein VKR06_37115 [Ktedonosporobacter sp.]|nr:hypothetical protein [Ktedonosporobacter sp.]